MKIYLLGDTGDYSNEFKKIINEIKKDKSQKIFIFLGDNFYPNGVNSINDIKWKDFENLNTNCQIYSILGNHDYLGNVKSQIEYNKNNWSMPYFYYKKTFKFIDLFFIDTSILLPEFSNLNYNIVKSKTLKEPLELSKEMIDWLKDELKKSSNLKMVIGHYPILSYGIYGVNKRLFKILYPIFKEYKVKYYISGHDHNLQIIDIVSSNFEMKQIISGATSHLYPIKNGSDKIFSQFGSIMIDCKELTLNILDINSKTLFSEDLVLV